MSKVPREIDGAKVLAWARSGLSPFGVVYGVGGELDTQIYGLAICQYKDSETVYRFSCDADWATVQDAIYNSITDAKNRIPDQYRKFEVQWNDVIE